MEMSENNKKKHNLFSWTCWVGNKKDIFLVLNSKKSVENQTPTEFKLIIIANNSHAHPLPLMYELSDRPPLFKSRLMLVNERIM